MAKKGSGKDKNTSEEKRTEAEDNISLLGSLLGGLMDIPGQAAKLVSGTPLEQVLKALTYSPEQLEFIPG